MTFLYTRHNLSKSEWRVERFLEILPAAFSWGLLSSLVLLCIFAPVAGVVIIILVDIYWLFRLFYLTFFLILSYWLLEAERTADWLERLQDLGNLDGAIERTARKMRDSWRTGVGKGTFGAPLAQVKIYSSEKRHLKSLQLLRRQTHPFPDPQEIFHLVIIPFYQEGGVVLRPTLAALARVRYPLERIVVVLGVEARAGEEASELAERLKKKYEKPFLHFEACVHPDNIPGEAAVKGANATYAAKWARRFFETRQVPLEHILVSCFDSDTVVSPDYFACLTYNYLVHPNRTRASFQPIPVFHNNLWDAPPFARVLETGSSFFQLIECTDPETLVTFSSHSMSFQALVEIDYWPIDIISDDSAIFWKAFLAFDGNYQVCPLYVTLSMDVVVGKNLWETCLLIYRQKRRWAWGVENFPLLVRGFLSNPRIPIVFKIKRAFRLLEMNISWAVWTPITLILSWMPAFVATHEFASSVAHFNSPRISGVIGNLALATLVISIVLSLSLLPKNPTKKVPVFEKITFTLQWLLIPFIAILFGSLPALDAQTRLALGKYMEFFVTPKGREREG